MAIKGNKDEEQRRRMDRRDFWRVKMAKETNVITYKKTSNIIEDARTIINSTRSSAVRSVDFCRVQMYWNLGKRIFEEEQQGKERADYGTYLIKNLASTLESEYGSGFGVRQLEQSRQFYDKEKVLSVARKERIPENPADIIKDPMILEFLGLERKAEYYEKDLESALIDHLQQFLLELGNGFSFIARQKRLLIEDDEYFADLVFYNRLLRCFVVIELKTKKLTHEDLGQLQMYVNYFDRNEKLPDENPTIGILLCTAKNDEMVKMTLPKDNKTILASKYELYLPSEETLKAEVKKLANAQEKFAKLTDGEQK